MCFKMVMCMKSVYVLKNGNVTDIGVMCFKMVICMKSVYVLQNDYVHGMCLCVSKWLCK